MKEENFEKSVEWTKKPNYLYVILGSILIILFFLSLSISMTIGEKPILFYNEELSESIFKLYGAIGWIGSFIFGWWLIFNHLGENKKIYLRKIK